MKRPTRPRRGAVLAVALVLLAAIAVVMGSLTWQSVAQRRLLAQREKQLQAHWLARGGLEHVRATIRTGQVPTTETWKPIPNAEVKIEINEKEGFYLVRSEAAFPTDEPYPTTRFLEAKIAK